MNATQFVRQQVAEAEGLSDAATAGVTDEQFNWLPPGTMNPIKSTLLHTVGGEDLFFQLIIQGRPPLWATGGWAGRIGLAQTPGGGQGWEEARRVVAFSLDKCKKPGFFSLVGSEIASPSLSSEFRCRSATEKPVSLPLCSSPGRQGEDY